MFGRNQVSDKSLLEIVSKRLARAGVGGLSPTVRNGEVTLAGSIKYEAQRRPALSAVAAIAGVRSVIDRLTLQPATRY